MAKKKLKKRKKLLVKTKVSKKGMKRKIMITSPMLVPQEVKIEEILKPEEVILETPAIITPKKKKKVENYIDNSKLFEAMIAYKAGLKEYEDAPDGKVKPRIPEYIGECILAIAERLATKPNFSGYSYKEEMIGDGIENCLTYLDNFDPAKSKNPFAYFTQIIYFAFLRRLQKEKKQSYIKSKIFEHMDSKGQMGKWAKQKDADFGTTDNPYAEYFKLSASDVVFFDTVAAGKKKKKKKISNKKSNLNNFFE